MAYPACDRSLLCWSKRIGGGDAKSTTKALQNVLLINMFPFLTLRTVDITVRGVHPSKDAFYRVVGERIAQARQRQQLTQSGLAPAVGLSRASVANVEKGRQAVALHVLVKFSQVLGVPVADLIPLDPAVPSSSQVQQGLSELSSSERAWAETVLGRS